MSLEGSKQGDANGTKIYNLKFTNILRIVFLFGIILAVFSCIDESHFPFSNPERDTIRSISTALITATFLVYMIDKYTKGEYIEVIGGEIEKNISKKILPLLKTIDKNVESKRVVDFVKLKHQLLTDEDFLNKDVDVSDIKLDNYINLTNIGTKPGLLRSLAKHFSTFIEDKLREEGISDNDIETYKILCPTPEHNSYLACRVAEELKLPSVFVREIKKPGKGFYDGNIRPNDKFILLNDVTLTGGTAIKRIDDIRKNWPNIEVGWAFAVFERTDEGANYRKRIEDEDINFFSMEKIKDSDINDLLKKKDRVGSKP
jgi:orotate phosphoribosyltransferase